MGNSIAMLSSAYYSVISPEGAASILGRYKDAAHKAEQFPKDCQLLAQVQQIYAEQLKKLGVIDEVVAEDADETNDSFPNLQRRLLAFYADALQRLTLDTDSEGLVKQRFEKFRAMGKFDSLTADEVERRVTEVCACVRACIVLCTFVLGAGRWVVHAGARVRARV
jgi:acetyl-CoA carboxylase alpha subunit